MGPGDAIGRIGTLGARAAVGPIDGERLAHAHAAPGGGRAAAGGRELGDEVVQRAAHTAAAQPQHMGVDHGRADIRMTQQFLHRADVDPGLQQMSGKGVAQGVRCGRLGYSRFLHAALEGTLEGLILQVVPAALALPLRPRRRRPWVERDGGLGKDPEPGPGVGRSRVLAGQRVRQMHPGQAGLAIRAVQLMGVP